MTGDFILRVITFPLPLLSGEHSKRGGGLTDSDITGGLFIGAFLLVVGSRLRYGVCWWGGLGVGVSLIDLSPRLYQSIQEVSKPLL